jgi:catechol 2,3-dioxygenase-like lactoylglutathione lyase family enzyme
MRLQLALNVDNLASAIDFYSKMFNAEPAKVKPGYANFAIENPPLKLVLFEGAGPNGSINHLGVEVEAAAQVTEAEARLTESGLATTGIADTVCCYRDLVGGAGRQSLGVVRETRRRGRGVSGHRA